MSKADQKRFNKILQFDRIPKKQNIQPHKTSSVPIIHPIQLRQLHRQRNQHQYRTDQILAHNTITKHNIQHVYNSSGIKQSVDTLIKTEPDIRETLVSNKIERLSQGVRDISGNNVMEFISKTHIPINKNVTYVNMVSDIIPFKDDKYRTRLTVGGDNMII